MEKRTIEISWQKDTLFEVALKDDQGGKKAILSSDRPTFVLQMWSEVEKVVVSAFRTFLEEAKKELGG